MFLSIFLNFSKFSKSFSVYLNFVFSAFGMVPKVAFLSEFSSEIVAIIFLVLIDFVLKFDNFSKSFNIYLNFVFCIALECFRMRPLTCD